jgi:hypothetical protein
VGGDLNQKMERSERLAAGIRQEEDKSYREDEEDARILPFSRYRPTAKERFEEDLTKTVNKISISR